jgi:hypothetical protein
MGCSAGLASLAEDAGVLRACEGLGAGLLSTDSFDMMLGW